MVFNWDDEAETKAGYTAAIEVVLGLAAQRMPVTEKAVAEWIDVSLSGIDEHRHIRRHALAVEMRMIRGPIPPQIRQPLSERRTKFFVDPTVRRAKVSPH